MASMSHRIGQLAKRIPRFLNQAERASEYIRGLSSGERRKRIAHLALKRRLGRAPTAEEVAAFVAYKADLGHHPSDEQADRLIARKGWMQ